MKRTWRKKIGAVVALLAAVAVLGTGCGADAAGAVESRTRETRALGLLLSREDTFLSELKADIEAEAAAQGYAVRYYNAGNDPETQLRQVHEALAEGVETLLVNLADGEDSEKVADIVGDAGVVLLNRAPGTAILNERMVFVGMDEAGSGALQGHALAEYFWETDHGTDIRYLLFQGMLDLGVTLSSKIEETTIAGKKVFDVADGFLIACFDKDVNDETIKAIAQKQPYYFVMRDSSLANDSVATNFEQIFATYSPDTVRKVL